MLPAFSRDQGPREAPIAIARSKGAVGFFERMDLDLAEAEPLEQRRQVHDGPQSAADAGRDGASRRAAWCARAPLVEKAGDRVAPHAARVLVDVNARVVPGILEIVLHLCDPSGERCFQSLAILLVVRLQTVAARVLEALQVPLEPAVVCIGKARFGPGSRRRCSTRSLRLLLAQQARDMTTPKARSRAGSGKNLCSGIIVCSSRYRS